MSRNDSTATRRRSLLGLGIGAGAAFATAVMISLGSAPAAHADITIPGTGTLDNPVVDLYPEQDPYVDLYGAMGQQGVDDEAASVALAQSNPGNAASFDTLVDSFLANNDHPLADLVNAIDPSAFYYQIDPVAGLTTPFLVPDDTLGYLAQTLDFGLLNPTGLGFVLDPLIEILLGNPPV